MGGFADYYGQTSLHPLAASFVLLLSVSTLLLPRRHALIPLFLAATSAPMSQRIIIAGADFTLLRILLLVYCIRVLVKGEWRGLSPNRLDTAVLLWGLSSIVVMTIRMGPDTALINRLGWFYDLWFTYYAARLLLRNIDDLITFAKATAIISIPVAAVFLVELNTRANLFSIFGGVPAQTSIREGVLRCQGPFAHPILAGTFWAATLPVVWYLWKGAKGLRALTIIGTLCCLIIVTAAGSSTPVLGVFAAVLGLLLYSVRLRRKQIWVGLIAALAVLHFFVMEQPVWHLMARAGVVGGSTAWHRFIVFDTFVNNFSEWYLLGHSNPLDWGVWQMRDVTNEYAAQGLSGGLSTLLLFLSVLVFGFGNIGKCLPNQRSDPATWLPYNIQWVVWLTGVALLIHVITFTGLTYFGQMLTIFYIHVAIVASIPAIASHGSGSGRLE